MSFYLYKGNVKVRLNLSARWRWVVSFTSWPGHSICGERL